MLCAGRKYVFALIETRAEITVGSSQMLGVGPHVVIIPELPAARFKLAHLVAAHIDFASGVEDHHLVVAVVDFLRLEVRLSIVAQSYPRLRDDLAVPVARLSADDWGRGGSHLVSVDERCPEIREDVEELPVAEIGMD